MEIPKKVLQHVMQFVLSFALFQSSIFLLSGKISYSYNPQNHISRHLTEAERASDAYSFPFLHPIRDHSQIAENPSAGEGENRYAGVFHSDQQPGAKGSDIVKGFSAIPAYTTSLNPTDVVIEDFNGDGRKDIAVLHFGAVNSQDSAGEITILQGNGNNTFSLFHRFTAGVRPVSLVTGDFNRDKKRIWLSQILAVILFLFFSEMVMVDLIKQRKIVSLE